MPSAIARAIAAVLLHSDSYTTTALMTPSAPIARPPGPAVVRHRADARGVDRPGESPPDARAACHQRTRGPGHRRCIDFNPRHAGHPARTPGHEGGAAQLKGAKERQASF